MLASGGTVLALSAAGALDRPAAPASAAAPRGPTSVRLQPVSIDEQSATIAVAAKVSPAVVRITVTGTTNDGNNGVIPETGVGSGVIFDSNGWILTNHHVVEGGEKFDVELKDGRVLSGKVYGIDTLTDLAIVKVDATGLPTAAHRRVGRAQGRPARGRHRQPAGHVLQLGHQRHRVGQGSLDHDRQQRVADQPHPDRRRDQPGQLGRAAARRRRQRHRHQHRDRLEQQRHRLRHPDRHRPADHGPGASPASRSAGRTSGIHFVSITRQLADDQKLPVTSGRARRRVRRERPARSRGVEAGKPAAVGGIKDGDIIASIDGKVIDEEHPLDATLAQFSPGATVSLDVLRDGKHVTLKVTLGTRPAGL